VIMDFSVTSGDVIALDTNLASTFAAVKAATKAYGSTGTIIDFGTDEIVLLNVKPVDLKADDFVFV
jgi:hypothetical protein